MFVSKAGASQSGAVQSYNLRKQIEVVKNCRDVAKHDLKFNTYTPKMDVNPKTYVRCIRSYIHTADPGGLWEVLIL